MAHLRPAVKVKYTSTSIIRCFQNHNLMSKAHHSYTEYLNFYFSQNALYENIKPFTSLHFCLTYICISNKVSDRSRRLPFRLLLHQDVREDTTPLPALSHFTLDQILIMMRVNQGGIKYHFLSLWYYSSWDWIQVSWPLANSLTIIPISWSTYVYSMWNIFYLFVPFLT